MKHPYGVSYGTLKRFVLNASGTALSLGAWTIKLFTSVNNAAVLTMAAIYSLVLCLSTEYIRGKYHCTVDLLFDWFGISCMTTDNFLFICKTD